jgi:hypothetical protein
VSNRLELTAAHCKSGGPAAQPERWTDSLIIMMSIDNMHECAYDSVHGIRVGSR